MGTILERERRNGPVGYHAQIAVQKDGLLKRETETFDRRPATAWIKEREHELQQPGARAASKVEDPTLAAATDRSTSDSSKSLGRAKVQVLRSIKAFALADMSCSAIGSADIVAFALFSTRRQEEIATIVGAHPCDRRVQAPPVLRMVPKGLLPARRAVSTTTRMGASPSAARIAR